MNSRFSVHFLLSTCLLILVGVMVWLSHSMLDAEKRRLAETRQIRLVEQSRLALWRMDSLLASMIAAENNRSPGEYFQGYSGTDSGRKDAAVPDLSEFARLYFQIDPAGHISSPQAEPERMALMTRLARSGTGRQLAGDVRNQPEPAPVVRQKRGTTATEAASVPVPVSGATNGQPVAEGAGSKQKAVPSVQQEPVPQELAVDRQKAFQQGIEDYNMRKNLSNSQTQEYNISVKMDKSVRKLARQKERPSDAGGAVGGAMKADAEFSQAPARLEIAAARKAMTPASPADILPDTADIGNIAEESPFGEAEQAQPEGADEKRMEKTGEDVAKTPGSYKELSISSLQPRWYRDEECFLTRRISDHGQVWVQGIWLDWDKLSGYLLKSVEDILPEASLAPAVNGEESYLTLAGIPAMLNPGSLPDMAGSSLRTVWNSMAMAWFCGILALCGVIGFMIGILRLSERRAVFVSAVTHELRTPLTTFNMYTEMLSSGLVPKGREMAYVDILKDEAARLTHLVDNVLSYARVEKNSVCLHPERIAVPALAASIISRISPRLAGTGMDSQLFIAPELQTEYVMADMTAVEQIVYNLADNAAKYAQLDGSILKVKLSREKRFLIIRVEDGGRGISESLRKKLFRPFFRSAEEAAGKQPGVGLGLALSRELARGLGGDLWLEASSGDGSRFALKLPLDRE